MVQAGSWLLSKQLCKRTQTDSWGSTGTTSCPGASGASQQQGLTVSPLWERECSWRCEGTDPVPWDSVLGIPFGLPSMRAVACMSKPSKAAEVARAGARARLLSEVHWDRRRGNKDKLEQEKFWPDIRGKNCHESGQTVEPDPGEGMTSALLILSICWTKPGVPCFRQEVGWETSRGPFPPAWFCLAAGSVSTRPASSVDNALACHQAVNHLVVELCTCFHFPSVPSWEGCFIFFLLF